MYFHEKKCNFNFLFCILFQNKIMTMRYTLQPNKLGKIVNSIDLNTPIPQEVIKQLVQDVNKHRLLIFKNQGIIPPARQIGKKILNYELYFFTNFLLIL